MSLGKVWCYDLFEDIFLYVFSITNAIDWTRYQIINRVSGMIIIRQENVWHKYMSELGIKELVI
jgi:hypothetical protein